MSTLLGQKVSHYTITEYLGSGGMGVVYKAEDTRLKRTVALKFLPPDLTRDHRAKERFIQEAQAVSALDHPNICTLYEIDETSDGQIFFAMACYEGETLEKMTEKEPLSVEQATAIAIQVTRGLIKAHESGIIHRDIKPSNIIVTTEGVAKIVDFGLAKLTGNKKITGDGLTAGTVEYMSPEQIQGLEIDHRTDIWSLGVVLYQILTGKVPFESEYPSALMYAILNEPHPPINTLRADVPPHLADLIERSLRKERNERPQSATEVLQALQEMPAQPGAASGRMFFDVRKPAVRWLAAIGGAVLLLLGWFSINRNTASEARYLVIADYQNMTNEHLFDHSLTEAIRVSLQQSNHVKVLSPSRISYARDLLRIPENSPLDEKAALAVARREGASAVVAGSIASVGTIFDLSCKIIDAGRGEPVAILHRAASTIEGVLGATDTLCSQLRHNLGESLSQISATNHRLEDLTTSSLQALELHAQAGVLTDRGEFAKAANLLRQAVELDSLFAMAVSDLSYDLRKTGEDSLACYYHARVLPLINRVTEAERFLILELYYGPSFEMDLRKAFENVEQAITRAPDDPEGYSTLGHLAMFIGDTRTALEANRKAAELSSDYASTSWDNSGYALALDSRNDEALDYFRRSKALRPDYYATDCYIAGIHWANGDLDSCEQTLRAVLASADPFRTKQVRVLLASLCYFRGRLVGARGECQAALDLPQSMKKAGDDSYFHYLLAEIAMAGGDAGTFKREMKRSVQQSISPYFELALAGMSYARNGFPREAEDVLSRISAVRSIDPYFVNRRNSFIDLVKGEMDFAARRYAEAQRQFASVPRARSGDPLFWIAKRGLANSMASLGDSSAFAVYSSILNRRGEAVLASLSSLRCGGPWTAWLWPETQVDLAVLLQASGERSKAMAALRAAQELWKGADISYRPALRAKNMLAKLEKQE